MLQRLIIILTLTLSTVAFAADTPDVNTLGVQARQGDAWAQLNLGAAYDNGIGVERNVDKALYWYQKAAEQGLAKAQFNLAHLLVSEEISQVAAADWMLKAAEQGMADAQYLMGVIYAEGIGVDYSDEQATYWLQKAAAQGQADAVKFLKEHYRSGE